MPSRLSPVALLLGLAGLIPFAAAGLACVATADAGQAAQATTALLAYGAVILSFLGGVHWGFAFDAPPTEPSSRTRLVFGVLPALVGWLALLTPLLLPGEVALAILIAGFLATVIVEAQLHRRGLVPKPYMWLRWGLSTGVVVILVMVLVLKLLQARIVL